MQYRLTRTLALFSAAACCVVALAGVPLRIVTYNVKEGIASSPQARQAAGHILTTLDLYGPESSSLMPDIVCLQETRNINDLNAFRDDFLPGYTAIRGLITDGFNANGFFIRGDIGVVHLAEINVTGPRRVLRIILDVPKTPEPLVIYNAHFKAGSTQSDIDTRAAEANFLANRVAFDQANGIDITGNTLPDLFPTHVIVAGDLNHHDFSGTTIDPLLDGGTNGLPTHMNDMRVETLLGAQVGGPVIINTWSTQGTLNNRFDYVLVSDPIFWTFDANGNGVVSQTELNNAGFVYISGDDFGFLASGQSNATSVASDHAPVVVDFTLPCLTGDTNCDGVVDLVDLSAVLAAFGTSEGDPGFDPSADFDGNGTVDLADLSALLTNFGLEI